MQAQIIVDRFLRNKASLIFRLNAFERILLTMLASYMAEKNTCYPSHQSLSRDCGMSTDSVGRYTKSLENKQLITISRITGNNNFYQLNIPENDTANSTYRSQRPPATSDTSRSPSASPPPADSGTNNIINNINEYTSFSHSQKNRYKQKSKNSSLPVSMEINEDHKVKAKQLNLDVNSEFEHFKEYYLAKGSLFSNWPMAFHIWLRNAAKFAQKKFHLKIDDVMMGVGHE